MTQVDLTVEKVVRPAPDAQIGVNLGGSRGYVVLKCTAMAYQPQVGDLVQVDLDGMAGEPRVVRCQTEGRTYVPDTVGLTVSNVAPTGGGWVATSSVYARGRELWVVRTDPVTPPSTSSLKVRPTASRTWDPSNNWRSSDTKVRQGSFGSGVNTGCWFYGAAAFAPLAGHTITRAVMSVRRDERGGESWGPMQLQVCVHPHASQPAGQPTVLMTESPAGADPACDDPDPARFELPAAFVAALSNGSAAGVGISSDATSDYLICLGPDQDGESGVIEFFWEG